MPTRITIIGGGSAQWVPILVDDFSVTATLEELDLVLHDIDASRAERTARYARHVAALVGRPWTVTPTTDQHEALAGADFVIVCISTGGLASMGADLALSAAHGVPMPIGDTVGPAGISRAWRNVPVLAGIARAMEASCPDAWMLNVTNPLTALTRAVTLASSVKVVGLCHEVTNTTFFLSQLLDCRFDEIEVTVSGVNHLPLVTGVNVRGDDRWAELRALAAGDGDLDAPLPFLDKVLSEPRVTTGGAGRQPKATGWTKRAVIEHQAVNYEILRRFGALPAANSDHTSEFFSAFVRHPEQAERRWGIEMVTVGARTAREEVYLTELERRMQSSEAPKYRSPEMVAPVIDALLGGPAAVLPLNIPNAGQCPDIPDGPVVESMCVVDAEGIRGRDRAAVPAPLGEWIRRVSASQELTVAAALTGDPDQLLSALVTDTAAGRLEWDALVSLRDDIISTNAPWRSAALNVP